MIARIHSARVHRHMREMPIESLMGRTFGRWTVTGGPERRGAGRERRVYWVCTCTCGRERAVSATLLRRGASQSCGCAWGNARDLEQLRAWALADLADGALGTGDVAVRLGVDADCARGVLRGLERAGLVVRDVRRWALASGKARAA